MKYVKTEDGKILEESKCAEFDKHTYSDYMLGKLKEADTIEDLCDRFVLIDKNEYRLPIRKEIVGKRFLAMLEEFTDRLKSRSDPSKINLYGAVWTEWGLRYVAKFNERGDGELL